MKKIFNLQLIKLAVLTGIVAAPIFAAPPPWQLGPVSGQLCASLDAILAGEIMNISTLAGFKNKEIDADKAMNLLMQTQQYIQQRHVDSARQAIVQNMESGDRTFAVALFPKLLTVYQKCDLWVSRFNMSKPENISDADYSTMEDYCKVQPQNLYKSYCEPPQECAAKGTQVGKQTWRSFKIKNGKELCSKLGDVDAVVQERSIDPQLTPCDDEFNEALADYVEQQKEKMSDPCAKLVKEQKEREEKEQLANEQRKREEAIAKFSPEMVAIPAGCFTMGSPESEEGRDSTATQHQVCVESFHIGKYEITRGQFRKFVESTDYTTEAERGYGCYIWHGSWGKSQEVNWHDPGFSQGDSHPAVCVSWNDVMAYAEWLSQETGRKYRLPTEAEWEYVARAGTTTAWYWGDNPDQACRYANVGDQNSKSKEWNWILHNCNDGYAITAPVGMFQANDFGVYDMLGNVWEWTCSVYTGSYSGSEKICVNKDNATGSMAFRGGAWYDAPTRFSNRNKHLASVSGYGMGGRLALDP